MNEPKGPPETDPEPGLRVEGDTGVALGDAEPESASPVVRGSRWVDYDTHELLEMISELEDERRWARLREGIWMRFSSILRCFRR